MSSRRAALLLFVACGACGDGGDGRDSGDGRDGNAAWPPATDGGDAALPETGPDARQNAGPDATAVDAATPDASYGAALQLPMLPVSTAELYGVASVTATTRPTIVIDVPLVLALGAGYPAELRGIFQPRYWADCGMLAGAMRVARVEGSNDRLEAGLEESSGIRVRAKSEGSAELVAFGSYEPAASEACGESFAGLSTVPVEMRIRAAAVRPAGARFTAPGCSEREPRLVATSSKPEISAALLDSQGSPIPVANAAPDRQVSLTLEAEDAPAWETPAEPLGLAALRWPAVATTVRITPTIGDAISVTVVDAPSVTDAEVEFLLGGYAAGALVLRDGESLGQTGWARVSNRLVPTLIATHVGAELLCSQPDPSWFELISETPSQCDVRPLSQAMLEASVVLPRPSLAGLSAYVHADGACRVALRAPRLRNGTGFEQRLSVTLTNVASLHEVP